jgi:FkbM family methyltransferase
MLKLRIIKMVCAFFPPILAQKMRSIFISIKDATKIDYEFKRKSFTGSFFYGNIKDFHAFKFYIHGYFDWRNIILTKTILKFKKGCVVEVGANIGTETISFSDICLDNVYAFEPYEQNYSEIINQKQKNKRTNLFVFKKAASDFVGQAQFNIPSIDSSGSGSIVSINEKLSKDKVTVEVTTLDEELKNVDDFSTIVIDVEGNEYNVLKGAKNIIKNHKPFIILEVNKKLLNATKNNEFVEMYNFINSFEYEMFHIKKIGLEKVNVNNFKKFENKNCVCIPKEYSNKKTLLSFSILKFSLNPFN